MDGSSVDGGLVPLHIGVVIRLCRSAPCLGVRLVTASFIRHFLSPSVRARFVVLRTRPWSLFIEIIRAGIRRRSRASPLLVSLQARHAATLFECRSARAASRAAFASSGLLK